MAIQISNSIATVTRGRGKSRSVVLQVSFSELESWAKRMQIDTSRLMTRSFGRAVSGLKKKFSTVMGYGGGISGVPKFKDWEDFTVRLRQKEGRYQPMGGILADKKRIVGYKKNGWQIIGWPDDLAKWAVVFQEGQGLDATLNYNWFRHYCHSLDIHDIPRQYKVNPRRVIPEPFGSYVRKNLKDWAEHNYYKELARQMAKSAEEVKQ